MKTHSNLLIPFSLIFTLLFFSSNLIAQIHPIWDPSGDIGDILTNVSSYLGMSDAELQNQLNTSGINDLHNIDMVDVTYDLALLYHLTGTSDYAHRAAVLLDRYADVFPSWPKGDGRYGYWTDWFHRDLGTARKLAEAYDLLYNSGAFESIGAGTKDKIKNLLILIIQKDFTFPLYSFNNAYYRPMGVVIFGRVLNDPELTHLGYWYHSKLIHETYCYDGFFSEGSAQYHYVITSRLGDPTLYRFYMNGYSDPAGYTHVPFDVRWDPVRIDNYDYDALFSDALARMNLTCWETGLPNLHWPIMNDTEFFGAPYSNASPPESFLMGGIGHGILARGTGPTQTQVRFDFSPAIGHRHRDAGHLIFYDKGTETVGGTAYGYGSGPWNMSTMNQNLVVVNELEQKDTYWVDETMSPYVPGSPRTAVTRVPLPSTTNVHNNLVLWEPGYDTFKEVQVTEVDALDAYSHAASRYRRVLALVNVTGDDVYLVDFFRVRGGTQYDWTLHGGHDVYSLSTDLSMSGASGSLGGITFNAGAVTDHAWKGVLDYGSTKHQVMMCGKTGTTVYTGTGLRSVYEGGYQDYVVARRQTGSSTDENFLAVHETYASSPHVQSVEPLSFDGGSGTAVGMKITLDNGVVDYVIHSLDEGPVYPEHRVSGMTNFTVKGRFAHVRVTNGQMTWMHLVQGERLTYDNHAMTAAGGDFSHRGNVTGVNRKEAGDSENSFEVDVSLPADGSLDGKTVIIEWGNGWTWGYKIKQVIGNRIITDDEPGFDYDGGGVYMQYFPVPEFFGLGSFPGPVIFIVPGSAVMDAGGQVTATAALADGGGSVLLEAKVFLESPYDPVNNQMTTSLNTGGYIPTTSPYSEDPRTISAIPEGVTDWVLVELRSSPSGPAVTRKSVLLHKHGRIVTDDGASNLISLDAPDGNYHIVVKHRNHLAVMSAGTVGLSASGGTLYDFTTGSGQFYGTGGCQELEPGVWGMVGGDADGSGSVGASDRSAVWNYRMLSGYISADCDLNGSIGASDRNIVWNNRTRGTQVPVNEG